MRTQQRQAWSVVGAMFVTIAITWGVGFDIVGLFYDSFFKEFGWTHAHFALLSTSFSVSLFVGGLTVGWLLDHVEAKIVVTGGALTAMAGLLLAGQAHSFETLMVAYFLLGLGNAAAAVVSLPLVINNWFTEGRGLAMGVTLTGLPTGEMTMAWTATYMILAYGWRSAYMVLGALVLLLVVPLDLAIVRTRPAGSGPRKSVKEAANLLPGLEFRAALKTRTFYMIALMYLCYTMSVSIALVHEVIYLHDGVGYSVADAGKIWALMLGSTLFTRAPMGWLADRIGNRATLAVSYSGWILAMMANIAAVHSFGFFLVFAFIFSFTMGTPAVVLPVILSEMLGLKRYGTFIGLMNAAVSVGLAVGPVIAGRIFDVTHSYSDAFVLSAVVSLVGVVAIILCKPPASELAMQAAPQADAAGAKSALAEN